MPIAAEDEKAVWELEASWLEAEKAGRAEDVGPLLTENVEFWGPEGEKMQGRDEAIAHLKVTPGRIAAIELSDKQISGGPDMIWKSARFQTRLETADETLVVRGKHLWVLEKQDSSWLVRLLCWEIEGVDAA